MKRRTAALLLVLAAVLTTALSAFAAAGGMVLRVGDVSVDPSLERTVRVPVIAEVNPGYVSASMTVYWDSEALILSGIEYSALAPDQGSPAPENTGAFTVRVGRSTARENITGTGVFFTLVFHVADGTSAGVCLIELGNAVVLDTDLRYVVVDAVDGTVTLSADAGQGTGTEAPTAATQPVATQPEATQSPTEPSAASESTESVVVIDSADGTEPTEATEDLFDGPSAELYTEDREGYFPWFLIAIGVLALCTGAYLLTARRRK